MYISLEDVKTLAIVFLGGVAMFLANYIVSTSRKR